VAETFQSDTPRESGWYFCGDDTPEDRQFGYWDAEARTFATLCLLLVEVDPRGSFNRPTVWRRTDAESPHKWVDDECGGSWAGPAQWHGPVEFPLAAGASR
jgi:hypothetical protein